ncbi:MAG: hypothetical protein RL266_1815 [Bacteroidota bacterium]|jgi:lipid-A-disaccharide synthase-like uncharacterized protein
MKYLVKALLVYLAAMLIAVLLNEFSPVEFNAIHISFCGLFMFGTSVAVHHFTVKASHEKPTLFPTYFMAITGLKMLTYLIALGVYVYIFKDSATPVIIAFLTLYVIYTVLEVSSALKYFKKTN